MNHSAVLLYVVLGLFACWIYANEVRRRRQAEAEVRALSKRLEKAFLPQSPERMLKKIYGIVADAHKQITAVTKSLQKPAN